MTGIYNSCNTNTRYLDPTNIDDEVHWRCERAKTRRNSLLSIARQSNDSRHGINWIAFLEFAKSRPREDSPLLCLAEIDLRSHRTEPLSKREIEELLRFPDNKLGRLPGILPLCQVMPVFITKNEATNIGIANGSMGEIFGIQFSAATTFESVMIHEVEICIASNLPEIVFVNVPTANFPKPFENLPSHYPRTTVPLYAVSDNTVQIKRGPHVVTIHVKQIPIVPAFAATTFKLQGVTCESIMAYILQESGKTSTSLYVILSRVRKMEGLFLYNKLTEKDFHYFKPPKKALEEEKRLKELGSRTLRAYQEGKLIPGKPRKVKDLSVDENSYRINCSASEKAVDKEFPTLVKWNKAREVVEKYKEEHRRDTMKRILGALSCLIDSNSSSISYTIHDITRAYEFCYEDSRLWTVYNVPGDGNCWIYATVFSRNVSFIRVQISIQI